MANNPANEISLKVNDQTRVSAASPVRQLEVPEIPGYHLYWFADRPGRIAWAQRVGYEFVSDEEVQLNNRRVGDDATLDGNHDLGSRVSMFGSVGERGESINLYLMKIKQEWYDKDRKVQEAASEAIVATLKRGMIGAERDSASDANKRYTKGAENLFTRGNTRRP